MANNFDDQVGRLLAAGGVGFMPSDTIYGLSCAALNEQAVEKIYDIKGRQKDKPLIILIGDYSQLAGLKIDRGLLAPFTKYWPGPLTIKLEIDGTPPWLERGTRTIAVRMPKDKQLAGLLAKTGPLISTSANPADEQPAETVEQAKAYFGDKLDFYVDVGKLSGQPSTIAKPIFGKLEVVRQGAVKIKEDDRA